MPRRSRSTSTKTLAPAGTRAPVRYRVAMPDPRTHEFEITMDVPALPDRARVVLVFPAWAPGSYMVRDFARHVYDLVVEDGRGQPLPAIRLDKQRWEIETAGRPFRVRYRVFAFEVSVRTSYLDDARAFWNGTSLFFFVDGEVARPCEVAVTAPRGWRVTTALDETRKGTGVYAARSFDELCDSPFEVGTHDVHAFTVGRTRFEVAFYGPTNADVRRIVRDLRAIVAAAGDLFDGFPFRRYVFIVHFLPARGGGLEHASSTTLDFAGLAFEDEKAYLQFAELAAHEFFHAWNVKRIHDRVLGPFDYEREAYTRLLWFHEGFTEYMEGLILLRAGLIKAERYLSDLADEWPRYASRPGRVAALSELSFEAWIKQYKPADNFTNRAVSYYEKGKWAALVLDLSMRKITGGRRGVPELFRWLWERFGARGEGITVEDVQGGIAELTGEAFTDYFRRYVDGHDELPVPALLRDAGVTVTERAVDGDEDDPVRAIRRRGWAGLVIGGNGGDRAIVRNVLPGSPGFEAGLTYGDEIVAIGGHRANAGNVLRRLADGRPGDTLTVAFFRHERLRTTELVLARNPERSVTFRLADRPPAKARAIRRGWLGR